MSILVAFMFSIVPAYILTLKTVMWMKRGEEHQELQRMLFRSLGLATACGYFAWVFYLFGTGLGLENHRFGEIELFGLHAIILLLPSYLLISAFVSYTGSRFARAGLEKDAQSAPFLATFGTALGCSICWAIVSWLGRLL